MLPEVIQTSVKKNVIMKRMTDSVEHEKGKFHYVINSIMMQFAYLADSVLVESRKLLIMQRTILFICALCGIYSSDGSATSVT